MKVKVSIKLSNLFILICVLLNIVRADGSPAVSPDPTADPNADPNIDPLYGPTLDTKFSYLTNKKISYRATNTCNMQMLRTYDLDPIHAITTDPNLICPAVKKNCCTLNSQMRIYQNWVLSEERNRVMNVYKSFINIFGSIFRSFKRLDKRAADVTVLLRRSPMGSCKSLAKAITDLDFGTNGPTAAIALAKKAYRFLYDSRRGFYCSLCDATAHDSILADEGHILLSHGFCGKLVEETLGFFDFKYDHFVKIARLYGEFAAGCSPTGTQIPRGLLKSKMKFFRDEKIFADIDSCRKNAASVDAVGICENYCTRFNPTSYGTLLEGDLVKLAGFKAWLWKQTKPQSAASSSSKADLSFKGRLLADASGTSSTTVTPDASGTTGTSAAGPKTLSSISPAKAKDFTFEINNFNNVYLTNLVTPITYSASEDYSMIYNIQYRASIFTTGASKIYDIAKFQASLRKSGINFLKYGYMANLTSGIGATLQTAINAKKAAKAAADAAAAAAAAGNTPTTSTTTTDASATTSTTPAATPAVTPPVTTPTPPSSRRALRQSKKTRKIKKAL